MKKQNFFTVTIIFLISLFIITSCSGSDHASLISELESRYDFDETVERLKENAEDAGWTVPVVHDMQANMERSGLPVLPAKIIEICNTGHAYNILESDMEKYNMAVLPCRVSVYKKSDGLTYVSWYNYDVYSAIEHEIAKSYFRQMASDIEDIVQSVTR
ncbi:DUF302 domain-containing protein [Marinilabiliaceae bacterium ANBcel2]|nr:DUF302 domain-containing protein [Marinilabiliaceae bacterium ANBcel2]